MVPPALFFLYKIFEIYRKFVSSTTLSNQYKFFDTNINAVAKRYRYTGKERDEESGLYYHGARYYIPWLCRWTAVDPMESKYAGRTPYSYSANSPVMFNDPSGMEEKKTQGTTSAGVALDSKYHPAGFSKEMGVITTAQGLTEIPYFNSNIGMGSFSYVHDSVNNMDYTIMKATNTESYYSWVNKSTGKADFFYDDIRNKDVNGSWTGEWVKYETGEQRRASGGIETADALSKGVAIGISVMVVAPIIFELGASAAVVEGLEVMGSTTRTLPGVGSIPLPPPTIFIPFNGTVTKPIAVPTDMTVSNPPETETFYRAMSKKEYAITGGLLQHRLNEKGKYKGAGPFITDRLDYALSTQEFGTGKYEMMIEYTVPKGTKAYLSGVSLKHPMDFIINIAIEKSLPIMKLENGGFNFGFPGQSGNLHFNNKIISMKITNFK